MVILLRVIVVRQITVYLEHSEQEVTWAQYVWSHEPSYTYNLCIFILQDMINIDRITSIRSQVSKNSFKKF